MSTIDSGKTRDDKVKEAGIPTAHLVLAIVTTIVGVLAVIGLAAATYTTITAAGRHGSGAWAGYLVGMTDTTLISFVVLATHYLRQRTIARNHERNDERLQVYVGRIEDDLRQWVTGAQVEIMSAFGEILTQAQAVDARNRDAQKALLAQQQLIMERQKGLAEAVSRALTDVSMRLGGSVTDLGRQLADRIAAAFTEIADGQKAILAQQQAIAERQDAIEEARRTEMSELVTRVDGLEVALMGVRETLAKASIYGLREAVGGEVVPINGSRHGRPSSSG